MGVMNDIKKFLDILEQNKQISRSEKQLLMDMIHNACKESEYRLERELNRYGGLRASDYDV